MSIIYAETCKDCCHINNCGSKIEKTTTTKKHTKLNVAAVKVGDFFIDEVVM